MLLQQVWAALASESLQPFMPLWLELASGAARGLQPHRDVAGEIADGFLAWVTIRLQPESDGGPASLAPLFLASIEGMYLLMAVGRGTIASRRSVSLLRALNDRDGMFVAQDCVVSAPARRPGPNHDISIRRRHPPI